MEGSTNILSIAEIVWNQLNPDPSEHPYIELEDVIEKAKNAYSYVLWRTLLDIKNSPEGGGLDGALAVKKVEINGNSTSIESLTIIDLPRDAGIDKIILLNKNGELCDCLTKTTPSLSCMKSDIELEKRYYRVGSDIFFPDGLPSGVSSAIVYFYGVDNDKKDFSVLRQFSTQVEDILIKQYMATRAIPVDETNNSNKNG